MALNVMGLATPQSAILSAVIFNALIIVALIPLALAGVRYRPVGADALLRRNLLVYGRGRPRRPLHRHQGHRPRARRPAPRLTGKEPHARPVPAKPPDARRSHGRHRHRLPAPRDRHRHGRLPAPGRRQPRRARASTVRGSALLGPAVLRRRATSGAGPPATSPMPYNAAASSGSNQGPTNPALAEAVAARVKALRDAGHDPAQPVPVDLVTTSASGLDPHISPAAAEYQAARVARARGVEAEAVRALVARHTRGPQLWYSGGAARECPAAQPRPRRLPRRR